MEYANTTDTPAEAGISLCKQKSEKKVYYPYRETIGSLMYLATVSRPYIAFIVNLQSGFVTCIDNSHVKCVKRVLKYLVKTHDTD